MNIHFDSCSIEIGKISNCNQELKLEFTPMAWAFTRLGLLGVCRYQIERRRSKLSTFSFCILKTKTVY